MERCSVFIGGIKSLALPALGTATLAHLLPSPPAEEHTGILDRRLEVLSPLIWGDCWCTRSPC